jgi:hypothetical protein
VSGQYGRGGGGAQGGVGWKQLQNGSTCHAGPSVGKTARSADASGGRVGSVQGFGRRCWCSRRMRPLCKAMQSANVRGKEEGRGAAFALLYLAVAERRAAAALPQRLEPHHLCGRGRYAFSTAPPPPPPYCCPYPSPYCTLSKPTVHSLGAVTASGTAPKERLRRARGARRLRSAAWR